MPHCCPRCHKPTLPALRVRWSSRESPAACSACGALSHVLSSTGSGIWVIELIFVTAALLASAMAAFWPLGLLTVPLAVVHNIWAWRRVRLWPISSESAAKARTVSWWMLAAGVLFSLFR